MNPTQLGKYTLIAQLGKGGFGTVYKATDPIGRTVAIKVLKPGWIDDPGVIARFRMEALTAGDLFHARIATILDFVEGENHPYLVMRYVDGLSLDKILTEKGRLDWETAVRIVMEVAEGLDYAHQRGFIHRDVKPANILISEKDGGILTDFGLVKAAQISGLSSSEVLLGSPPYIAPEVWQGKRASFATDIYSLACVFYEMITGKMLFTGDSSPQIMTRHVLDGPQFPPTWPEKIPTEVEGVLRKALMMEPGERYPSASAFAKALDELRLPSASQQDRVKSTAILGQPQKEKSKRAFVRWSVISMIFLGILAVGLILVSRSLRHQKLQPISSISSPTPTQTKMAITPTALNTPTLIPTALETTLPTPSLTKVASQTAIPLTSTPRLSLPVYVDTPIPQPQIPISVENADQVTQLARLGKGSARKIALSPDGRQIAIAHSFGVYFYDAQSLQQISFVDLPSGILSLAYSPDGSELAISRSDYTIQLIQVINGNVLQTLTGNMDEVQCVAFNKDGEYLASGAADGLIRIWRLADGKSQVLGRHQKSITDIAYSPDGLILASGSADNVIKLWNWQAGSLLKTLPGHSGVVNEIAFSPDGKSLASASNDLTVRLWKVPEGTEIWQKSLQDYVYSVAFSPDGKIIATGTRDNSIRLYQSADGSKIRDITGHRAAVKQIIFSLDGKTIASISEDGNLGLFFVGDGKVSHLVEVSTGLVRSVTFTADNKFVAAGTRNGIVQLWDVTGVNKVGYLPIHASQVNSLFAIPVSDNLASGSDDTVVKIWTLAGREIKNFTGSQSPIESVAISSDGLLLAAGGYDGSVYIWQISDGTKLQTLKKSEKPIWSVVFSPDNMFLAVASLDGWIRIWKTADWSSSGLDFNLGEGVSVYSLAFSPDSKFIAFSYGDLGIIRLLRISDGALQPTLEGHKDQVWSMCFTTDSQILASGSLDGTIRLWRVSDGSILTILQGHINSVSSLACSPNGKFIASGSWDGTIRLWGIMP